MHSMAFQMKKIEIASAKDCALLNDCYEEVFLNQVIEKLDLQIAKLLIRKSIFFAPTVTIVTTWSKEMILDAALASCNPIKSITWIEIKDNLLSVEIKRSFP